jgi:predicted Zn-dependent protease with MMP-like domain
MQIEWKELERLAWDQIEATLDGLPGPLRERAQALPVTIERRPNAEHCRDGVDADTLGLFVGPEFAEEGNSTLPLPSQIILFLQNIWDECEGEEEVFCDEVRVTYLHELGHYLGLDEDDLFKRGLE